MKNKNCNYLGGKLFDQNEMPCFILSSVPVQSMEVGTVIWIDLYLLDIVWSTMSCLLGGHEQQ